MPSRLRTMVKWSVATLTEERSRVASWPFRLRGAASALSGLALLVGLLGLTAWNVTRSAALMEARRKYARGELVSCLEYALDHLQRRPWSREAALLAARCLSRLDHSDAAEPYYERAGELDLDDLQTRAFGLARGNDRLRAIEAYDQILARWPENVTAPAPAGRRGAQREQHVPAREPGRSADPHPPRRRDRLYPVSSASAANRSGPHRGGPGTAPPTARACESRPE